MTSPIPGPAVDAAANTTVTAKPSFAFTIYENQRWRVGLDWTAALLPGERPSWCSAPQAPLSPPATFALPAPTTGFLPDNNVPDARKKRTAMWAWAEAEWQVVVRQDREPSAEVNGVEENLEVTQTVWCGVITSGEPQWQRWVRQGSCTGS